MVTIDEKLTLLRESVNSRYFNSNSHILVSPQSYLLTGLTPKLTESIHPNTLFKPDYTPYGVVLNNVCKDNVSDIAILGFTVQDESVDVLEIHGAQRSYKKLTPIWWDGALLDCPISVSDGRN